MRRTVLPLLLVLSAAAHAAVEISSAYPTDAAGNSVTPRVGEPFYLTVNLQVSKGTSAYKISIDAPSGVIDLGKLTFGVNQPGTYWVRGGQIVPLYDGAMDVTVTCSAAKKPFKLHIVPTSPLNAFETYRPQQLSGQFGATVQFDRVASRLLTWLPLPQTAGFQTVQSLDAPVQQGLSREVGQPIGLVNSVATTRVQAETDCTTTANSVRTNFAALRTVPMSAIASSPEANLWLKPETRIESTNKDIVSFAKTSTKGMTSQTPVADAALAIYSAILKRSTYANTDALPDAVTALKKGKGECGDLSALFVATCRASGIPARPVSGFTLGTDQWHVWAEFLVPGIGWVPVDPAYAVGRRPKSTFPLYFGVVPELRDRIALCTGFSQSVGTESTTFLQTPQIFTFQSGLKVKSVDVWCNLTAVVTTAP